MLVASQPAGGVERSAASASPTRVGLSLGLAPSAQTARPSRPSPHPHAASLPRDTRRAINARRHARGNAQQRAAFHTPAVGLGGVGAGNLAAAVPALGALSGRDGLASLSTLLSGGGLSGAAFAGSGGVGVNVSESVAARARLPGERIAAARRRVARRRRRRRGPRLLQASVPFKPQVPFVPLTAANLAALATNPAALAARTASA